MDPPDLWVPKVLLDRPDHAENEAEMDHPAPLD